MVNLLVNDIVTQFKTTRWLCGCLIAGYRWLPITKPTSVTTSGTPTLYGWLAAAVTLN